MAHEILEHDSVLSTVGTEWHGKAIVQTPENIYDAAMQEYDFPLIEAESLARMPDGTVVELKTNKTIIADISKRGGEQNYIPLYTPTNKYRPIPNGEILRMVSKSIDETPAFITSVGTLSNLQYFFVTVDLKLTKAQEKKMRAPNGDVFRSYLSFMTSHNGELKLTAKDTNIRIICYNTFTAARFCQAGALDLSIRHTKNAGLQMNSLADYLGLIIEGREKMVESMGYLLDHKCSTEDAEAILAGFYSDPDDDELSTNAFNRTRDIVTLYKHGIGNKGETDYDLFNGLTEYNTHGNGAGGKNADAKKRWASSEFGRAAMHKENFLYALLDSEKRNELRERGGRLFNAKAIAMVK